MGRRNNNPPGWVFLWGDGNPREGQPPPPWGLAGTGGNNGPSVGGASPTGAKGRKDTGGGGLPDREEGPEGTRSEAPVRFPKLPHSHLPPAGGMGRRNRRGGRRPREILGDA